MSGRGWTLKNILGGPSDEIAARSHGGQALLHPALTLSQIERSAMTKNRFNRIGVPAAMLVQDQALTMPKQPPLSFGDPHDGTLRQLAGMGVQWKHRYGLIRCLGQHLAHAIGAKDRG